MSRLQGSPVAMSLMSRFSTATATELEWAVYASQPMSLWLGAVETYTTGIGRFAGLVDGKHAYTLGGCAGRHRPVKTFALYAGLFANSNKVRHVAVRLPNEGKLGSDSE